LNHILQRRRDNPVFQALTEGRPEAMGIAHGVTQEFAETRIRELGSCCLWCDEFFERYYSD
jgi:hypothetical protein